MTEDTLKAVAESNQERNKINTVEEVEELFKETRGSSEEHGTLDDYGFSASDDFSWA